MSFWISFARGSLFGPDLEIGTAHIGTRDGELGPSEPNRTAGKTSRDSSRRSQFRGPPPTSRDVEYHQVPLGGKGEMRYNTRSSGLPFHRWCCLASNLMRMNCCLGEWIPSLGSHRCGGTEFEERERILIIRRQGHGDQQGPEFPMVPVQQIALIQSGRVWAR